MDQQIKSKELKSRPLAVTLVCLAAFVEWGLLAMLVFLMVVMRTPGSHGYLLYLPEFFLTLFGLIGFWKMKRWGIIVYTLAVGIRIYHHFDNFNMLSVIFSSVIILVGAIYFREMD